MRLEPGFGRRVDDQLAAGQSLADVVVGLADQLQGDAVGQEGAEALAGGPLQADVDGVVRQTAIALAPGHFAGQHRSHGAVGVADGGFDFDRRRPLQRRSGLFDQAMIQRPGQAVILDFAVIARCRLPPPAGTAAG